jgi:phosphoglycerol transferase
MVETLVFAGFGGVYVDRFGYSDHGAQLESDLADQLGTKPILSANQRMSFSPMVQVNAAFREKYTPQEWQMKEDAALHPILADWRLGFYQLEGPPAQTWRWCCYFSRGELFVFNLSPSPKRTQFEMVVSTGYPELSHLVIETPWFSKEFEVSAESRSISIIATVPPGRHVIRFMSDAKPVEAGDRRTLIFRISDFRTKSWN